MDILAIANRLIELNKAHDYETVYAELYSPELISYEPHDTDETAAKGFAGVAAKGEWWKNNFEPHSVTVTGPWPFKDRFIVGFEIDVTDKNTNQRSLMSEMALYTVENGKIVKEEFFYTMDA